MDKGVTRLACDHNLRSIVAAGRDRGGLICLAVAG